VGKSKRTDASFSISVIDLVGGASVTSVGFFIQPAGRSAGAPSSCIDSWEVRRADASLLVSVIDLVGGACLTEFCLFIEEFGRSTGTFSIRGSNGIWRTADFKRSSW